MVGSLTSIEPANPADEHSAQQHHGGKAGEQDQDQFTARDDNRNARSPRRGRPAQCALPAAATANTLSSDMITSATVMVIAVRHRLAELPTSLSSLITHQLHTNPQQEQRADYFQPRQRQEIQGERQQQHARQDRPTVPMMIALVRFCGGSLRQAMAITTALSPPSSKSMATICSIITAMSHCWVTHSFREKPPEKRARKTAAQGDSAWGALTTDADPRRRAGKACLKNKVTNQRAVGQGFGEKG